MKGWLIVAVVALMLCFVGIAEAQVQCPNCGGYHAMTVAPNIIATPGVVVQAPVVRAPVITTWSTPFYSTAPAYAPRVVWRQGLFGRWRASLE